MKQQRGAALVVVLSMLAMSLMLGLSGMQSSLIEERLAGNYKATADAQMAAERAASSGWEYILSESFDEGWVSLSDLSVSSLESLTWEGMKSGMDGGCVPPLSCYYIYVEDGVENYIVAMGGVGDGELAVSELLIVEIDYSVGSAGLIAGAEAALTCVGDGCGFFAKTPPTVVDGRDYKADVDTKGKIESGDLNLDDDGNVVYKASYIVPSGSVDLGKASVTGEQVYNEFRYDGMEGRISETWSGEDGAEKRIKTDIDNLVELGKAGDERIAYWDSSSEGDFAMPTTGIVVVDGTDLVMDVPGNFKFTGLIVVRNGSFDLRPAQGAGTVAVVGAIFAQDARVDMQNGNPSLLYSSEALCLVGAIACENGNDSDGGNGGARVIEIKSWY
ncbi:PilX N-terminal domain-containing pilus assembly protein [Halomonas sp. KM-1]|uniref:pilus assembly PilX family protein n=1 Tax=Halomonas sp. KM-1 TaxID=590061 RepID=UPI00130D7791|nr:PilX N-terminal domain-containing pilus assembly protein [Halomonas sp. KM-1]